MVVMLTGLQPLVALVSLCVVGVSLAAQEVSSLQVPPARLPQDMPVLTPLLSQGTDEPSLVEAARPASDGAPRTRTERPPSLAPATRPRSPVARERTGTAVRAWEQRRARLERDWQELMGAFPQTRDPLKAEFLEREELATFTRQLVRYQVEEGVYTDGWLLVPKPAPARAPAMVVFHPTIATHTAQVSGRDSANPEKMQGVQLVSRGYVVLCPRCFIFADGADYLGHVKAMQARHPGWTGMARMTFDGIRAVDFLESLPCVDRNRIGGIGHSLGAKEVLYAAAFDPRYKVAVFSEGGIGLGFSNWDAEWYLGPRIKQPGFRHDNHELMALIAPRAFLLLAGESADGDRSWAFVTAARPVYQLLGAAGELGWFNHRLGHRYPPNAQAIAEAFLDERLKPR
jgi:dienelactone hydrolase